MSEETNQEINQETTEETQEAPEEKGKKGKKGKKEKKEKKAKAPKEKKAKPPKEKKAKKEKAPKPEKPVKLKKCPSCNEMIPKKAKVCPHCAAKQKSNPLPLVLIVVVLILVTGSVSVFFFHFPFTPPFDLPFGAKNISDSVLGAGMELSKKEESSIQAVLEECGFGKIAEVRLLSADENFTLYAVHDTNTIQYLDGDAVVEVNNETKAVRTISFGSHDLYVNGYVIAPVTDYYLSGPERDVYLAACLDAVKEQLDIPETAVFPAKSNWQYTLNKEHVTVNSTVTFKDTTGQEVTRPFQADFEEGELVAFTFLSTAN